MTSIKYMPVLNENGVKQGVYGTGSDICHLWGVMRFKGLLGGKFKKGVFFGSGPPDFFKGVFWKTVPGRKKKGVFLGVCGGRYAVWYKGGFRWMKIFIPLSDFFHRTEQYLFRLMKIFILRNDFFHFPIA